MIRELSNDNESFFNRIIYFKHKNMFLFFFFFYKITINKTELIILFCMVRNHEKSQFEK